MSTIENHPVADSELLLWKKIGAGICALLIGGLGIHLVVQLMDQVSYQRREGHNVVVLVKQLVNG